VLQTTAGKMIFGKFDERGVSMVQPARPVTAGSERKVVNQTPAAGPSPAVATEHQPE
jgi:hypothetical protein